MSGHLQRGVDHYFGCPRACAQTFFGCCNANPLQLLRGNPDTDFAETERANDEATTIGEGAAIHARYVMESLALAQVF